MEFEVKKLRALRHINSGRVMVVTEDTRDDAEVVSLYADWTGRRRDATYQKTYITDVELIYDPMDPRGPREFTEHKMIDGLASYLAYLFTAVRGGAVYGVAAGHSVDEAYALFAERQGVTLEFARGSYEARAITVLVCFEREDDENPEDREDPPEHLECPKHGSQLVKGHGSTGGPDPYSKSLLACGDAVVCLGPDDPMTLCGTWSSGDLVPERYR